MASKLPKHHPGQVRSTTTLSFSVPLELEEAMNRAAVLRGMNRSQLVVWLVRRHLEELPTFPLKPPLPDAPSRVRKKLQS
jgi:hypothetical protein